MKEVMLFLAAIQSDSRISPTHISLYLAVLSGWQSCRHQNPVPVNRRTLMKVAKINGLATFHRRMRELHQYGYLQYEPSYHPAIQSRVKLVLLDKSR